MKKKIYNVGICIYFLLLIIAIIVSSFLFTYRVVYNDFISNILILFGIIGLIFYVYYRFVFKQAKIYDLLIILMAFLGYLSYLYAYDKNVALKGFLSGREGLLVIISYYIFFLLASTIGSRKTKNIILFAITGYGLVNTFYGILQIFGINEFLGIPIVIDWKLPLATGIVANSNFFGSLSVIMVGIWLAKYLLEPYNNKKIVYFLIMFLFLIGLFISGAMSAFVALVIMVIISFIYIVIKRKNFRKKEFIFNILSFVAALILSYTLVIVTTDVKLDEDISELGTQITESATGNVKDHFGTGRIYIWKKIIEYLPDYLYTGIGIDNIAYIGNKDREYIYDPYTSVVVYKAHNEYLQVLATQGIFMFIVYIFFLGLIFVVTVIRLKKDKSNNKLLFSLFLAFCGYAVQAFFNISITRIAPLFFIITGLLIENEKTSF